MKVSKTLFVSIFLTTECNLNCKYCYVKRYLKLRPADININKLTKFIEDLTSKLKINVCLEGGEPTLYPYFVDVLKMLIENRNVERVAVLTNGVLFSKFVGYLTDQSRKFY